jgi:hypothetical protein
MWNFHDFPFGTLNYSACCLCTNDPRGPNSSFGVSDEQTHTGNGVKTRAQPENSREAPAGRPDYRQKPEDPSLGCGKLD